MNEESQNPHRTLMLTFSFDIDIEKVYLGIFSKQCLEKIGLYRTDISTTEDEIERYLTINSLPMDMHKLNFISTPTSKTIEEKVVSLNKKSYHKFHYTLSSLCKFRGQFNCVYI